MKKGTVYFFAFIVLILLSCGEDDTSIGPDYASLEVVTGMDLFDENGQPIGRWRSPNNNPGEVFPFPNPSTGVVSVFSLKKVVRVLLIPAICFNDTETADIPTRSQSLAYDIPDLEAAQIFDLDINNFNNQVSLNFEDVAPGFYRLFFQLDSGELFWENLYIDPTANNIPDVNFLDGICK